MTTHEGPRILVIEDEESYRDSLRFLLGREGFRVTLAATGPEGVAPSSDRARTSSFSTSCSPG